MLKINLPFLSLSEGFGMIFGINELMHLNSSIAIKETLSLSIFSIKLISDNS